MHNKPIHQNNIDSSAINGKPTSCTIRSIVSTEQGQANPEFEYPVKAQKFHGAKLLMLKTLTEVRS
jgi:hypothetical protein